MSDPRWTILTHGGRTDDADACLAAAAAGATVLRYGGGAVQAVEAALRSFRRGAGEADEAALDGLVTDGRTLRPAGDDPTPNEGRWGAVALDGDGHLAAGGWGDAHADDAVGAASVLGGDAARIVQAMEEGAEPQAVLVGGSPTVAIDRLGRIGSASGGGAAAIADSGSKPRLVEAAGGELLNG